MFKPTGNRIVLRVDETSDKTEGGLYVPQTASTNDGPKKATVVSASPFYYAAGVRIEGGFQEGDRVLVDALGGSVARIEGANYLVVRNEDIIGKFVD